MKAVWAMFLGLLAIFSCAEDLPVLPIASGDWPPYITAVNPGQSIFGGVMERTAARIGMRVDWQMLSWPLVEKMVSSGKVFAGLPYVKTPERLAKYDFSQALYTSKSMLFYRRDNQRIHKRPTSMGELAALRIAGPAGYWWELEMAKRGAAVLHTGDEISAFKVLEANRVDAVPQDELVGRYMISKLRPLLISKIAVWPMPEAPAENLYLIISREYPDTDGLRQHFAKALADELKSGSLSAAVNHYLQSTATTPP